MLAKYQSELSALPKGTISEKTAGAKTYYYLKYMVKFLQEEEAIAFEECSVLRFDISNEAWLDFVSEK